MNNDSGLPLITVVGSSSKQGRSVVDSLVRSGRYRVRALTRRLNTALAQRWRDADVDVRAVGLQPGMQQNLTAAFEGVSGSSACIFDEYRWQRSDKTYNEWSSRHIAALIQQARLLTVPHFTKGAQVVYFQKSNLHFSHPLCRRLRDTDIFHQ